MSIEIEDPNNPGQMIQVFTPDEVQSQLAEKETAIASANAEVEKYKRVAAEQGENFKKLSEMTAEEKNALSAEKLETLKRLETAEAKANAIEEKYNNDTKARIEKDKTEALRRYHGDDPKLKEALEKNFEMIGLTGDDTQTIYERARLASAMEAGKTGARNPLMGGFSGSGPSSKDISKTQEFLESDKGKRAQQLMG